MLKYLNKLTPLTCVLMLIGVVFLLTLAKGIAWVGLIIAVIVLLIKWRDKVVSLVRKWF